MMYSVYDGVYIKVTQYYDNGIQSCVTIVSRNRSIICIYVFLVQEVEGTFYGLLNNKKKNE